MHLRSLLVAALAALLPVPVAAADDAIDCREPTTTVEINFCADETYQASDAALNAVYQKALAGIRASDLAPPHDRKSWEEALRASQRAWVAFRDADCKGAVPMEWSGGSITTSAVLGCMTQLTDARVKDLKTRYGVD